MIRSNELSEAEAAQDAKIERSKAESRMYALADSADAIADATTRSHVASLIYSAAQNATDTIDIEGEATDAEWESLAKGSLRSLLDCGGDNVTAAVLAWFAAASREAVTA